MSFIEIPTNNIWLNQKINQNQKLNKDSVSL